MEDLSFSWPLQNPQNSEMLLQPHCSEALVGEQEDENGNKIPKVLWIAKVQGKPATPKHNDNGKVKSILMRTNFPSVFLKQSSEIYSGRLPLHSIP